MEGKALVIKFVDYFVTIQVVTIKLMSADHNFSGQTPKKDELRATLKSLEQEELRYVKAWFGNNARKTVYTNQMNSITCQCKVHKDELDRPDEDKLAKATWY